MTRAALLLALLISSCNTTPTAEDVVKDNLREVTLADGTRCVVTLARHSGIAKYPVAITCDWQPHRITITPDMLNTGEKP
jgi:hypothetical protein